MKKIITISREFGAGGGEIGRKVAERLGSVQGKHTADRRIIHQAAVQDLSGPVVSAFPPQQLV